MTLKEANIKSQDRPLYAVIDLGSNSFYMMIACVNQGVVQVVGIIKQKVRLASGLNENNELSLEAMERGWKCLAMFAERLQDIEPGNVRIVGTATLRLAKNVDVFLKKAHEILGHSVNVISGEKEAETIYLGVAHTSFSEKNRLVIDIGGASTEMIVGTGFTPSLLTSLSLGCVTWLERYFADGLLNESNFSQAIKAAEAQIEPVRDKYVSKGWDVALGASGTVQAICEILATQSVEGVLTLERLEDIKQQAIRCGAIDGLSIEGLVKERVLVFPSGLAILIAIFRQLKVKEMTLAGGALREGVLYGMLPEMQNTNIRQRTIDGLVCRFGIDKEQGEFVASLAKSMVYDLNDKWQLARFDGIDVLDAAAKIHELGLIVEYRKNHRHGAYILENSSLPGFTQEQHQILNCLIYNYRQAIDMSVVTKMAGSTAEVAERLTRILRVAVILAMRRKHEAIPKIAMTCDDGVLRLNLPGDWLTLHPLMQEELNNEIKSQATVGWAFELNIY